jgi:tetratricopeptide (TPR) repeat protein
MDRRVSAEWVAYLGLHILWYYVSLDLFRRERPWNAFSASVTITGAVIAAPVVATSVFLRMAIEQQPLAVTRISSLMLNPNLLGAYLCLAWGYTHYHLIGARTQRSRCVLVVMAVLLGAAVLLTQSRGALLNLAVFAVTLVIARWLAHPWRLTWKQWLGVLAVIVAVSATLGILVTHLNSPVSNAARLETWRVAVKTIARRPGIGAGPGLYGRMWLELHDPAQSRQLFNHAHNLALTVAAETGLVSIVFLAVAGIVSIRQAWRRLLSTADRNRQWKRMIALATLVGFMAHLQVEYLFDYPLLAILLLPLLAQSTRSDANRRRPLVFLAFPTVVVVLTTIIYITITPAFGKYDKARAADSQGDLDQATRYFEQAIADDPTLRFYQRQYAIILGDYALKAPPVTRNEYNTFEDAFLFSGYFAPDHAFLACLEWNAGNLSAAITRMERACELDPANMRYALNLGMYYEAAGNLDQATAQYRQVVSAEPSILAGDFWIGNRKREALRYDLSQTLLARLPLDEYSRRGELFSWLGDFETASRYYVRQTETVSPFLGWLGLAELALTQADAQRALAEVTRALTENPEDSQALLIRARIELLNYNPAAAMRILAGIHVSSPSVSFFRGEAALLQGDLQTAEQWYLDAIHQVSERWASADRLADYHFVGRRPRMETEEVRCLDWPFPDEGTTLPAKRLFEIYRQKDDQAGMENLRQMLPYSLRWIY